MLGGVVHVATLRLQIGHHVGVVSEEILHRVFHVLDTDGSGAIDFRVRVVGTGAGLRSGRGGGSGVNEGNGVLSRPLPVVAIPCAQEFVCALFVFRRGSKQQKLKCKDMH